MISAHIEALLIALTTVHLQVCEAQCVCEFTCPNIVPSDAKVVNNFADRGSSLPFFSAPHSSITSGKLPSVQT